MPASMIRADTGGRAKVVGSRMAMVWTGPMPGQHPDQGADQGPHQAVEQVHGRNGGLETEGQVRQQFHRVLPCRAAVMRGRQ